MIQRFGLNVLLQCVSGIKDKPYLIFGSNPFLPRPRLQTHKKYYLPQKKSKWPKIVTLLLLPRISLNTFDTHGHGRCDKSIQLNIFYKTVL